MAGAAQEGVFLNLPYDTSLVDLFLAYIAGLTTLGLTPRVTLEIGGGARRLDRMFQLISECRYSVHELSPLAGPGRRQASPRLNMAFELGLVVALDHARPGSHTWFACAARRSALNRSLSDLAGTDAYFHGGRPAGLFRELGSAFVRGPRKATVQEMNRVFAALRKSLPGIKRRTGARSPFSASVFDELRVLARTLASRKRG